MGYAVHEAYYAMYHAGKALLAVHGVLVKTHAGVLAEVARLYVRTGKMPKSTWALFERGLATRIDADYGVNKRIAAAEAETMVADARRFCDAARHLLPPRT